jgi:hypothetical protein
VLLLCMEMESILRGSFVSLASKGYPSRDRGHCTKRQKSYAKVFHSAFWAHSY